MFFRVEFTSGHWRSISGHWFGQVPLHLGHLSLGLLVYLFPNMKQIELFIGLSALPFLPLWWLLPESPRWLLSKGRNREAIKILKFGTWHMSSLHLDTSDESQLFVSQKHQQFVHIFKIKHATNLT